MKETTEADRPHNGKPFGLEDGTCYLIRGKQAETSYLLFQGLVEKGTPGLCITRMYPEKVRSRYGLASVPVWEDFLCTQAYGRRRQGAYK